MKATVLSDGAWGTTLALLLLENGHAVTLWGPFADYVEQMRAERRNERFLPGVPLPQSLALTADMQEAVTGAELIVHATPTKYARQSLEQLAACGGLEGQPLVNVAKGLELDTLYRMSELVADAVGDRLRYAVLSGPSHAEEVCQGVPTAVVVAAQELAVAESLQQAFMNDHFRVYSSDDVVGVELGGSLKNVFAIAAGICDGMALGDNPKAALLTRGIAELARLGQVLGGHPDTFSGLSGIGDMIVTCMSGHSRNRHVGNELGAGKDLDTIIADMGMVVAEGVTTTKSAWALAQRAGVSAPIVGEIYGVLYENKNARQALTDLMTRDPRPERDAQCR